VGACSKTTLRELHAAKKSTKKKWGNTHTPGGKIFPRKTIPPGGIKDFMLPAENVMGAGGSTTGGEALYGIAHRSDDMDVRMGLTVSSRCQANRGEFSCIYFFFFLVLPRLTPGRTTAPGPRK